MNPASVRSQWTSRVRSSDRTITAPSPGTVRDRQFLECGSPLLLWHLRAGEWKAAEDCRSPKAGAPFERRASSGVQCARFCFGEISSRPPRDRDVPLLPVEGKRGAREILPRALLAAR